MKPLTKITFSSKARLYPKLHIQLFIGEYLHESMYIVGMVGTTFSTLKRSNKNWSPSPVTVPISFLRYDQAVKFGN